VDASGNEGTLLRYFPHRHRLPHILYTPSTEHKHTHKTRNAIHRLYWSNQSILAGNEEIYIRHRKSHDSERERRDIGTEKKKNWNTYLPLRGKKRTTKHQGQATGRRHICPCSEPNPVAPTFCWVERMRAHTHTHIYT
jgi:hypothetical protein